MLAVSRSINFDFFSYFFILFFTRRVHLPNEERYPRLKLVSFRADEAPQLNLINRNTAVLNIKYYYVEKCFSFFILVVIVD